MRRQLAHAQVQVDERAIVAKVLKSFKDAGDYDPAIREWEARPAAMQTYVNLRTVMNNEFTKLNRQDATTARATGHASANNIVEDIANTTGELVAVLTDQHTKQVEALMKTTTAALEKLTAAIIGNKPTAAPAASSESKAARAATKAAAWAEKKRVATTCTHCNLVHPNRTHAQCWELPENAATRKLGWKSVHST